MSIWARAFHGLTPVSDPVELGRFEEAFEPSRLAVHARDGIVTNRNRISWTGVRGTVDAIVLRDGMSDAMRRFDLSAARYGIEPNDTIAIEPGALLMLPFEGGI